MMITVSFHEEDMNQITVLRQTTRRSVLSLAVCAIACWSGTMDPACRAAETQRLCDVAAASVRPQGAPAAGAVCFSSRWKHPASTKDPYDTFQVAAAFHATDFVWVYSLDKQFVQRMKQSGAKVCLAVNSMVPDAVGTNTRRRGRLLDLDGNLLSAPWMRTWKENAWGCVNSPEYRASFVAHAAAAIDAGSDTLQMDDPATNMAAVRWGGCFCTHCMAGFRTYLKRHATAEELARAEVGDLEQFDYRAYLKTRDAPVGDAFAKYDGGALKRHFTAFQEASVRDFFIDTRAKIDAHAGRHVVFSSNNYAGRWTSPYDLFELGMAELPERDAKPAVLYQRFADARQRGKAQLYTLVPQAWDGTEVTLHRRIIATCYAFGGHLIVPWDVYTGSGKPRYYGKPEDYADLYKFVRDNARFFDGYEDAAFLIPELRDERYADDAPMSLKGGSDVTAVARAVPGKADAPVAIHLVDWRADPQPITLTLVTRRFTQHGPLGGQLLQPGKPAVRLELHADGTQTTFEIPRLSPWAMLVVSP